MYRVWLTCQSQSSLFRAKESPLKKEIIHQQNNIYSEMCCGNPLQGKLLPVGWKLAQWSYELEKKATPHQGIWMSTRPSCFFHWPSFSQGEGHKRQNLQNVYSNLYSQAVTHPSTNRSRPCLTSVIGRELVHSRWYGRRHPSRGKILMQNLKNSGTRFSDFCCINVQFLRLELPSCWNFC